MSSYSAILSELFVRINFPYIFARTILPAELFLGVQCFHNILIDHHKACCYPIKRL